MFTAALLHDIGKLALGNLVQKDLDRIRDMVAKGISFEVAEYIVLGTNHADIGARILKKWSLPAELVNAVLWHHDPDHCAAHCVLSDVVHAAIARLAVEGEDVGRAFPDRQHVRVTQELRQTGVLDVARTAEALDHLGDDRHGLLAEHIDPRSGEQWGNFVQTYSMVGLIQCAARLSTAWEDAY